ncbi:putative general secretion pathway protein YghD [Serratia quinivorans]|uniref:type II secretion system protein M n=1 Tax=Serratia quinivorans TaxID=137545 RepID=UPI002179AE99|nr:type II secretion system protein M [Serratia quinivorans]CAI1926137.1 putative general secretion pathway protein YghD [Serratia quinivorans]
MKTLLEQRWQRYSQRERLLLLLGSSLLFLLLFRALVLTPLETYQQHNEAQTGIARQELLWLQAAQPQIVEQLARQPSENEHKLSEAVRQSAQRHQLALPEFPDDTRQIVFTDIQASFTTLMAWLNELENQYAIQASELTLAADPTVNGAVYISRLVLQRDE